MQIRIDDLTDRLNLGLTAGVRNMVIPGSFLFILNTTDELAPGIAAKRGNEMEIYNMAEKQPEMGEWVFVESQRVWSVTGWAIAKRMAAEIYVFEASTYFWLPMEWISRWMPIPKSGE